jgi:peptidoglycan/LPS O-acetylase OafA/YrhL
MRMEHPKSDTGRPLLQNQESKGPDRQKSDRSDDKFQTDRKIRDGGHIPKLDSLRGAAILMVVVYHAYGGSVDYRKWHGLRRCFLYLSRYGYTGVELFFVLSGFLITRILLSSKDDPDFYGKFYKRRALRILPAYLAILVVVKIWLGVTWKYVLACLLYIANMAGLLGARTSEYGPLWSLAVEEQFYLLWPWCVRRFTPKSLYRLALGICCAMPLFRLIAAYISPAIDVRYKTYFIADYLAYGAVMAIAVRLRVLHAGNIRAIARGLMAVGATFAAAVLYCDYGPNPGKLQAVILRSMGVLPFVWVYCSLVLCAIYRYDSGDVKCNRALAFLGYISYGLYLVHEFIFYEYGKMTLGTRLDRLNHSFTMITVRFFIVAAISVVLAYLSRRFYEESFLRIGRGGTAGGPSTSTTL